MFLRKRRRQQQETETSEQPPLPPPPSQVTHPHRSHRPIPPRRELLFHVQLAHGSPTKDVKDFANIKELYSRIGEAFELQPSNIIFCTLNTPKVDMTRLLGGQIGLDDFIFTHVKGHIKLITLVKRDSALGLTITDNGAGNAFIKRVKDGSVCSSSPEVSVGDMIAEINRRDLSGCRHFEVAKMLKELPLNEEFTLTLIEPLKTFTISPRGPSNQRPVSKILDHESTAATDEVRPPTLRLKSDGQVVMEEAMSSWKSLAIGKVDDLLESFVGIRDSKLAHTIVELAKDKTAVDDFAAAIDSSTLSQFQFPYEFILELWEGINSTHTARV